MNAAREDLFKLGYRVGIHNDYVLVGVLHTFWLFTHPNGTYVKGEGLTDEEACLEALRAAREGWSADLVAIRQAVDLLRPEHPTPRQVRAAVKLLTGMLP